MNAARVLVAEADPGQRAWIASRLARAGHGLLEAGDADTALSLTGREAPDVAIVGGLPGTADGLALLERLAACAPGVTALVVSGDQSVATGVAAMKAGAVDFLVLPCVPETFDAAVESAVRLARTRRNIAEDGARREPVALVGRSAAMQRVRGAVERLAASETTVLLQGETGTGKEVVAQALHSLGARAGGSFLKVNCAAFPEALIEAELFGHERGAFTAASGRRAGIFEAARGGTVLLDEIGDLPASQQATLLRLLENRTFRRVGGVEELSADVRVIAATHANLEERVAQGRFRADLFFRLNVVNVELPPLRERREDIPPLAAWFVARLNERMKRSVRGISAPALEALEEHAWPGNVRELRNAIERAFILHPWMEELRPCHLGAPFSAAHDEDAGERLPADLALPDAERWLLADAMRRSHGNQVWAARMLGITRFTLRYRLRKYGLRASGGCRPAPGRSAGPDGLVSAGHAGEVC